jgi:RNA polymerase sigma-70 factor (ECF subfamily)
MARTSYEMKTDAEMDLAMTKAEAVTFPGLDSGPPLPFESLYETYRAHVYRFARSLAGEGAEAEDLFQETWLRAAKAFGGRARAGDARAWLFTITANLHKDSLRKKRVRRLFWLEKTRPRDSGRKSAGPGLEVEEAAVPDDAARAEFRMCLRRAISSLKPRERRVFVLKEIEGYKHQEIAAILSVPENTVRSRLHRAVRSLQKELGSLGFSATATADSGDGAPGPTTKRGPEAGPKPASPAQGDMEDEEGRP